MALLRSFTFAPPRAELCCDLARHLMEDRNLKAAIYCAIGAVLSFFGIIHAATFGINAGPAVTMGYLGMAIVLVVMTYYRKQDNVLDPEVLAEEAAAHHE